MFYIFCSISPSWWGAKQLKGTPDPRVDAKSENERERETGFREEVAANSVWERERCPVVSIFDALSYKTAEIHEPWIISRFNYFQFYFRRSDHNQRQAIFRTIPLHRHIFTFFILFQKLTISIFCPSSRGWVEIFLGLHVWSLEWYRENLFGPLTFFKHMSWLLIAGQLR